MEGYEFTKEDVTNIARLGEASQNLTRSVDALNESIRAMTTRCEKCRGELDQKLEGIQILHAEQKGVTKGQAVGYGSIPTLLTLIILGVIEYLKTGRLA